MSPLSVPSLLRNQIRRSCSFFSSRSCSACVPLVVTGIAQVIFPVQANGNVIEHNGKVAGSALVGQPFTSANYFWGRPSATSPVPYNAGASSGSNLGPNNPALIDAVKARVDALHAADPKNTQLIPVDLVTASGSGLDPDISIAAAEYQVPRVARERNLERTGRPCAGRAADRTPPVRDLRGAPRQRPLPEPCARRSQCRSYFCTAADPGTSRTLNRSCSACGCRTGSS